MGFGHEKIEVFRAGENDTDSDPDADPEKIGQDTGRRESVFSEVSDSEDFLYVLCG